MHDDTIHGSGQRESIAQTPATVYENADDTCIGHFGFFDQEAQKPAF